MKALGFKKLMCSIFRALMVKNIFVNNQQNALQYLWRIVLTKSPLTCFDLYSDHPQFIVIQEYKNTFCILVLEYQPGDGRNTGQNLLVRILWIK
jgi:hypothetical protein